MSALFRFSAESIGSARVVAQRRPRKRYAKLHANHEAISGHCHGVCGVGRAWSVAGEPGGTKRARAQYAECDQLVSRSDHDRTRRNDLLAARAKTSRRIARADRRHLSDADAIAD